MEPSLNSYVLEFFFKLLGDRKAPEAFWVRVAWSDLKHCSGCQEEKDFVGEGKEEREEVGEWGMEMKQETDSFSGSGECDRTWAKEVPIF